MMFNNVEVLVALTQSATFFPDLFRRLTSDKLASSPAADSEWVDHVSFLQVCLVNGSFAHLLLVQSCILLQQRGGGGGGGGVAGSRRSVAGQAHVCEAESPADCDDARFETFLRHLQWQMILLPALIGHMRQPS